MQQSITGSLRPRNANVAPTDPSTGIRVSSGNTGNSGNASRTLGSGTGTASQYPALESYQRTLDSMGRRGLLTGATAAGWNASHPTEAAAVRLNELIAANRPAGTTGSTANSAGTGNTSAASAGRNSGNTGSGNTASAGGSTGSTGSAGSTGSTGTRRNDQMRDWRVWLDNYDAKYGGDIMSFDPSTLSGDDLVRYYQDLNIYTSLASTVSAYDAEVEAAEQAAREKEQYAAYRRAMLQKYLPETLSAMGLDGRGTSESAIIQMNNNIDNYVAGAMSEKNAAQSSALQQYQQLAAQMMQERNNQLIQDAQAEAEQTLENLTLKVQSYLDGEGLYTREEIIQAVNDANVSDEDKDTLARMLNERYDAESGTVSNRVPNEDTIVQYGISDTNGIAVQTATVSDFGDFSGTGSGGKQDAYILKVLSLAKSGQLKNGTVVDFNYGIGTDNYVYYEGKFYKTKAEADINNDNIDAFNAVEQEIGSVVTNKSIIEELENDQRKRAPYYAYYHLDPSPYATYNGKRYKKEGNQWIYVGEN